MKLRKESRRIIIIGAIILGIMLMKIASTVLQ